MKCVAATLAQTGELPSGREIAEEVGVTKRTVNLHLKALREAGLMEID
ncbi:helix-turn-helix domain-containing protein [Corynebacterium sp. HMSC08C04]|nr:helix-turn-helix domain-containing protein [Corynebacterium sp. HMSC08C04]